MTPRANSECELSLFPPTNGLYDSAPPHALFMLFSWHTAHMSISVSFIPVVWREDG